ncbi:MAG: dockerin type I domain-containing protein [Clostridiales Family XIII bacterium]|jgi:hypothetical protein|nr:dockerin type I domain-containing protein [Clostridiales Family XIII bacterium]
MKKIKTQNIKRLFAFLLTAALLVSLFPTSALAESPQAALSRSAELVEAGQTVDISLGVTGTADYASIQATVTYDASMFTYSGAAPATGAEIDVVPADAGGTLLVTRFGAALVSGEAAAVTLTFTAKDGASGDGLFGASEVYVSAAGASVSPSGNVDTAVGPAASVSVTVREPGTEPSAGDEWKSADLAIYTADDLFDFAASVNAGNTYAGKVVRLARDIDLGGRLWTAIGYNNTTNGITRYPFSGTFDGDGFTVSGLYLTDASKGSGSWVGFFGYVSGATVKNLTVTGSMTLVTNAGGSVVGYAENSQILSCVSNVDITSAPAVGGIVYNNYLGVIRGCVNNGNITLTSGGTVGGIAASTAPEIYDSVNHGNITSTSTYTSALGFAAGILGQNNSYSIINGCYNDGNISTYSLYAAGIVGNPGNGNSITTPTRIENCYNLGNIENKSTVSGSTSTYAAGIAGITDRTAIVQYNYSTGAITATAATGVKEPIVAYLGTMPSADIRYNGEEYCKSGDFTPDGKLKWQSANPAYTVSFTGGEATVSGVTAEDFVLARGHYGYTASVNGAAGEFWVTRGGKTIALSADVTFANLTEQGAEVTVTRGSDVQTAVSQGLYSALPNGEYSYSVTVGGDEKSNGTFLVAGMGRTIAVEALDERVAVMFDVLDANGIEVPNAQVTVRRPDNSEVPPESGLTFMLYSGAGYTYSVTAQYFGGVSNVPFTAGDTDSVVDVELTRLTAAVSLRLVNETENAIGKQTVSFRKSGSADELPRTVPPASKSYWEVVYGVEQGIPYDYTVTQTGYETYERTGVIFGNASNIITVTQVAGEDGEAPESLDPDTGWYTAGEPYIIRTPQELAGLAKLVNEGTDFAGKTVTLGANINLGELEWIPIGTNAKPFEGTFDGASHKITGLSVTGNKNFVALFGCAAGTLKDFEVYGEVSGGSSVAGVAAQVMGSITGVTNYVNIVASGDFVGGIAADAIGGFLIEDCHNKGALSHTDTNKSTGRVGGILGRADNGFWDKGAADGKLTIKTNGRIANCSNTGNIHAYQYVGGIIGGQFGDVDVQYCYNSGNLTGVSFGKVYLGGIAGKSAGGTIDSCYNRGTIYNEHWSTGHVRAIGGIAGCEEGREDGTTAITNVYNTGEISFRYDNIMGIYELGNISGGNWSTADNKMRYENAFYLPDLIEAQDPSFPKYASWSTNFTSNPLAYDTIYTTKVTVGQLRGEEPLADGKTVLEKLGTGFAEDVNGVNSGYPILKWQAGDTGPVETEFDVAGPEIFGGAADSSAAASVSKAVKDTEVTITVVPGDGKQVYKIEVTDAAGTGVGVTKVSATEYKFTMPGRRVDVAVTLENVATSTVTRTITLPAGLDPIWAVTAESTGSADGRYLVGSTVFVTVSKNAGAASAALDGIIVSPAVAVTEFGEGNGKYAFTMPDNDLTIEIIARYSLIEVREQIGADGEPVAKRSYTREQMTAKATENVYYSGWYSEVIPLLGRADLAVPLTTLLADAGITFEAGDVLKVVAMDGFSFDYPYEELIGVTHYYYPNIFNDKSTEGKVQFDPILVVKGNVVNKSEGIDLADATGDQLNAYRFIFGQTETDFANQIAYGNRQPKHVVSITVVKPLGSGGTGAPGSGDIDGDGTVTITDALFTARAILGLGNLTAAQILAADVDNDGHITMADVIFTARKAAGL